MLTEVKVFSSWRSAPTLLLSEIGRAETDLIQILNIDGLDPVKAAVNRTSFGSIDGSSYVGSNVPDRNIVLTLHPNPTWNIWTHDDLRKLIYTYFMSKQSVRLVFYSDDMVPVEISGIVESVTNNRFSKDPEFLVSIICPDPYFSALEGSVLAGAAVRFGGAPVLIDYNGNIEAGFHVQVSKVSGSNPALIGVQIGNPAVTYFTVDASVDETKYFEMNTVPMRKYVQNVNISSGAISNLLAYTHILEGIGWPLLQPGENEFSVITDVGVQDWELVYYERFGGL